MIARILGVIAAGLLLLGCHADQANVAALERAQGTRDVTQVQATSCTDRTAACSQLYEQNGAKCLKLTEAADPQTRAVNRACALSNFRNALAFAPPDADKLVAARGLAEALRIDRDNTPDAAQRDKDAAELDSVAAQLGAMPGGAAYGGYYAANNDLNRVLRKGVPADQTCATLTKARGELPSAAPPGDRDFPQRLDDLRSQIATVMRARSCG